PTLPAVKSTSGVDVPGVVVVGDPFVEVLVDERLFVFLPVFSSAFACAPCAFTALSDFAIVVSDFADFSDLLPEPFVSAPLASLGLVCVDLTDLLPDGPVPFGVEPFEVDALTVLGLV